MISIVSKTWTFSKFCTNKLDSPVSLVWVWYLLSCNHFSGEMSAIKSSVDLVTKYADPATNPVKPINRKAHKWTRISKWYYCQRTYVSHALQWLHNERDGVSNHRRPDYVYNRLFRRRSSGPNRRTCIWVRSWRCGCLVTWFCYRMIANPGNKRQPHLRDLTHMR